jgi:hypothetical protein
MKIYEKQENCQSKTVTGAFSNQHKKVYETKMVA